ncbi:MAG TPA: nitronate monooxygenase [Methylibium sp.]|uniref:NAD(P)H-dependent flavin oxidoreductase n=1 Tax=Methylibium sp. TaxID=2067992 RepID=UPI002DBF5FAE|nr:nitronate monooxygenase [Methylibium sp.]HEU4459421.1 nitronate monooxygenase [Methylibium sp.]
MNALAPRLGIELPIVQALMAGLQLAALPLAVGAAGALGSLPAALLDAATLKRELDVLHAAGRPYNLNFFCHAPPVDDPAREDAWRAALAPHYAALGLDIAAAKPGALRQPFDDVVADLVEPYRPRIVSFHFGLPEARLLARVKAWGAFVLSSATTIAEARWLEAHGADAVIAQGLEAGGHRGMFLTDDLTTQQGTFTLLPQIVRAVRVPVIAAGGIADANGVRAAFALGASAVQAGTAYLLSDEATTAPVHRAALMSEAARHTALTRLHSGRPARGIVNGLTRAFGPMHPIAPDFPLASRSLATLRAAAEAQGIGDYSPLWSGQCNDALLARPAAEITRGLAEGWPG